MIDQWLISVDAAMICDEQSTNAWMEMRLGRNTSCQLTCTKMGVEPKRIRTKLEKFIKKNRLLRKKLGIET